MSDGSRDWPLAFGDLDQPEHGGRLLRAARRYGIPEAQWLDLSTAINPHGWPVPELSDALFNRLPEIDDGLEQAAADYYGSAELLLSAGSQALIQTLPLLRLVLQGVARVGVVSPSYQEHGYRWRLLGHQVSEFPSSAIEAALPQLDVVLIVNPNNPDGTQFDRNTLTRWCQSLSARGGWLVVDEAFIDAMPELSLIEASLPPGLIVLRSLGKFFGLAGIRVGACFAQSQILRPLKTLLGSWTLATPSRHIARLALRDLDWQQQTRRRLLVDSKRLHALLVEQLGADSCSLVSTPLFVYLNTAAAAQIAEQLASRGVLVRQFAQPAALRFGFPGSEAHWQQLSTALSELEV